MMLDSWTEGVASLACVAGQGSTCQAELQVQNKSGMQIAVQQCTNPSNNTEAGLFSAKGGRFRNCVLLGENGSVALLGKKVQDGAVFKYTPLRAGRRRQSEGR